MAEKNTASYGAHSIQVLEGLEPVRKRPGMYIGGTGLEGLHHLIWEVVDNAIDEAMAGFCTRITVRLHADGSVEVEDDGRGIPVEIHPQTKKSTLETVMTVLHAGGKFGGGGYKVSGGLHGVGVSVVNALSEWTHVSVRRDGKIWEHRYERGVPQGDVKATGKWNGATGTTVRFLPDKDIFPDTEFRWKTILDHLRQQAYLTKGIRIQIDDRRTTPGTAHGFYFDAGILSFVHFLNRDKKIANETPFLVDKESGDIAVEVALQYTDGFKEHLFAFANNIFNPEGGTHVAGFRTALTRVLNTHARKANLLKEKDEPLTADDVREGLTAVISIKLPNPQFEGQTKAKLGNPEARGAVASVVGEALGEFLETHPKDTRAILEKCLLSAKARIAARAAKDAVIRKGALEGLSLPGKLADCSSHSAEESELYIVEGDSAGGSAKQGRDRRFQAILPLRGKMMNVEKTTLDKIVKSETLKPLILALGVGIGESLDIAKLRYGKIILMADADVDGSHIRTLLLTLLYRHFEELVRTGHVYIAQPPLYRIQKGRDVQYVYTDQEKETLLAKMTPKNTNDVQARVSKKSQELLPSAGGSDASESNESDEEAIGKRFGVSIQRYKGLGEMNPTQLRETTMDPRVRKMYQVTLEDAEEADRIFDLLMGSDVEPRRHFIQTHAAGVKNLDV